MRLLSLVPLAMAALPRARRALFPSRRNLRQRLAGFPAKGLPLSARVRVRWNDFAVPFIEAANDDDLAFALGLVHAHLREGQLALAKRIVYGRLAEIAGRAAWDYDHLLRIMDFPLAADAALAKLPDETQAWMQRFADGLTWYQNRTRPVPPEYGLLGMAREPWTVRDLLAIGRLAGTDINWLSYFGLIGYRGRPDWPLRWQRALEAGDGGAVSFSVTDPEAAITSLLLGFGRSGSNCVVVSRARSATAGALLAADPHLTLMVPNLWVLVGVRSPSLNVVGLMPAGLPIFGLGRNRWMAWGGTNMRAAVSDLYDASGERIERRTERLRTRMGRGRNIVVRRTRLGPVLSDSPLFRSRPSETVALRWMGHEGSDEITAFLRAARAATAEEFRAAFATYAVGPQNMQFADAAGNIGQIMATWLPRRRYRRPRDLVLDPRNPDTAWEGHLTSVELPWALNPPEGVLASANNPPAVIDVPIGFFFITGERIERLHTLLARKQRLGLDDLSRLQHDVVSPASLRLKEGLIGAIEEAGLGAVEPQFQARLRAWDGSYAASAAGPVAFETLLYHVSRALAPGRDDWNHIVAYLLADLANRSLPDRTELLVHALADAAADAARFENWGAMHRMRVGPVFAHSPILGRRFRIAEYPASGSRETVMKTFHGLVRRRHVAEYGSQSRFLADLSDQDATHVVLFGGQDGWLGSQNFADQIPLWRRGETIRMPLTTKSVERDFPIVLVLEGGG
ncbi:MAG: penicillin acylase family protein [Acetobacteraceae bacterium]|nr:penicillin acylase family protein [Acetobacteraceae bacterium]